MGGLGLVGLGVHNKSTEYGAYQHKYCKFSPHYLRCIYELFNTRNLATYLQLWMKFAKLSSANLISLPNFSPTKFSSFMVT